MFKEIIVVEGRNDEAAVKRAVEAETIATHGYGIKPETFKRIEKAYAEKGIIIFTDPDFAGEKIRKRLAERFPYGKHAFLSREDAMKNGDVGIENAAPEMIRKALERSRPSIVDKRCEFKHEDLLENSLVGAPGATERRDVIGQLLGIGYGNAKVFLNRLNQYDIKREEFIKALTEVDKHMESGSK